MVICRAQGKDGRILDLDTQWAMRHSEEERADYDAALEGMEDTITNLKISGEDIKLESDAGNHRGQAE